jgi:transcriptional regulator with XRE-family HTH domain
MVICDRLRALREEKKLSQGDIEKRTGLLRCYISRVENGHTVPTVETLEKMARALDVPLYRLFYDGEAPPKLEICRSGKRRLRSPGEPLARRHDSFLIFGEPWGGRKSATGNSCCLFAQKLAAKRNGRKSIAA